MKSTGNWPDAFNMRLDLIRESEKLRADAGIGLMKIPRRRHQRERAHLFRLQRRQRERQKAAHAIADDVNAPGCRCDIEMPASTAA